MKKYIGGYAILDLASTTIYADALGALTQDKPVLVYDLPDVYFADTIKATTIEGDDVVQITKGGKTITIANDNTITNVGEIQNHLYAIYFQIADGDTTYFGTIFTTENVSSLNTTNFKDWCIAHNNTKFIGNVSDYDAKETYSLVQIGTNGVDFDLSFNNGYSSTNTITTITSIEVIQLY